MCINPTDQVAERYPRFLLPGVREKGPMDLF